MVAVEVPDISKPYPRKGTETCRASASGYRACISKPYPRKGTETRIRQRANHSDRISKSYPRKGTETSARYTDSMPRWYFKTISPQGDGNCDDFASHFLMNDFKTISPQGDGAYLQPPLPRRGRWHTQCAGGGAMDASCKSSYRQKCTQGTSAPIGSRCLPLPP